MGTLALMGAGFAVWAGGLVAVYAALSIGCALAPEPAGERPFQHAILLALALIPIATTAWVARRIAQRRRHEHDAPKAFVHDVAFYASLAANVAAAFTFSGLALLPTCG